MKRREEFLNKLDFFLMQNGYSNLKEINIKKNQELFFSEPHIIIKGKMDVYIMSEDGNSLKVITLSPEDCILGIFGHYGKHLNIYNMNFYYKSNTDVILKKIPNEIKDEILKVPDMNRWFFELIFERTALFNYHLFMRNMVKSDDLIKFLLKKEAGPLNIVAIDNVFDFIDKYNISRSTFYKGMKKLEEAKEIKRDGKKIILIK